MGFLASFSEKKYGIETIKPECDLTYLKSLSIFGNLRVTL